jgi:hypothetical protein
MVIESVTYMAGKAKDYASGRHGYNVTWIRVSKTLLSPAAS